MVLPLRVTVMMNRCCWFPLCQRFISMVNGWKEGWLKGGDILLPGGYTDKNIYFRDIVLMII